MTQLHLPAPPLAPARAGNIDGISYVVLGQGSPVTVFAHGLGGSIAETRPLAARVSGTRVLLDFRGHGDSALLDDGWDYDGLADDLLSVADAVGASQAVGLSLGSGALLRALSRDPDRFRRLAFLLPAAIDGTRRDGATERLLRLGAAIDRGASRKNARRSRDERENRRLGPIMNAIETLPSKSSSKHWLVNGFLRGRSAAVS